MRRTLIKVIAACITTISLVMISLSGQAAAAECGSPVFKSIALSSTKVSAGDTVMVEVIAESGGCALAGGTVGWFSPSGQYMEVELSYNESSGKLDGALEVNRYAEPGTWACAWIDIYNEEGFSDAEYDEAVLRAANLRVSNDMPDLDPPEVLDVHATPTTVEPGGRVMFTVTATDDLSGVKEARIDFQGGTELEWLAATLEYDEESGLLEGYITIPDDAVPGERTLSAFTISDNAGNEIYVEGNDSWLPVDLSKLSFSVVPPSVREPAVPPVIMRPTSGARADLQLADEDPKRAGLQVSVEGIAVPEYQVSLLRNGTVIASTKADYFGVWKTKVTVHGSQLDLRAVAKAPSGATSTHMGAVTRGQAAKLLVKLFMGEPNAEYSGYFDDVAASYKYALYIEAAFDYGLLDGDENGRFRPDEPITRAELVKGLYMANMFEDVEGGDYLGYFTDVAADNPYVKYIESAVDIFKLSGNPNGTFIPDKPAYSTLKLTGFAPVAFADVLEGDWFAGYVQDLFEMKVVHGYAGNTFKPAQRVTRAEFVKMICEVEGWALEETETTPCVDVAGDHWAYPYVTALRQRGVVSGYPCGRFLPDRALTRAEAVKMLVEAAELKLDTTSPKFYDCVGHWASDYILTGKKHKLISGYPDGSFKPENQLTRAEAAKLIWAVK